MSKLTAEEIIEKITENLEPYEFGESTYGNAGKIEIENEDGEEVTIDLGDCEMVADEEFTSGEAYRVIHFKEHGVYIRQNGYYNSYESYAEYDEHDYDEVVPFEKTVIDYKKVDGSED